MKDNEFDNLLFKFSQTHEKSLRDEIRLELCKSGNTIKRINTILDFIRTYVPKDIIRHTDIEFEKASWTYLNESDVNYKIDLRKHVVSLIKNSQQSRSFVQCMLNQVKILDTQPSIVDAINVLAVCGNTTTIICMEMLGRQETLDPESYIIAYAAGSINPSIIYKLSNSIHSPMREAAIELLAIYKGPKSKEELKRLALSDDSEYIRELATEFLNQY